ncbi:MAG TPA: hypothetical protein VK892_22170 [Pyrinomonadaceae bacterium]|nr:hypothetical protein [Pyrinomonadaceae bacterium]
MTIQLISLVLAAVLGIYAQSGSNQTSTDKNCSVGSESFSEEGFCGPGQKKCGDICIDERADCNISGIEN